MCEECQLISMKLIMIFSKESQAAENEAKLRSMKEKLEQTEQEVCTNRCIYSSSVCRLYFRTYWVSLTACNRYSGKESPMCTIVMGDMVIFIVS